MAKQLVLDEARRYLKSGVDAVANAVATTLGPRPQRRARSQVFPPSPDGVTVA